MIRKIRHYFRYHQRYVLIYCLSLGMFCVFGTRSNFSRCLESMRINKFTGSKSDDVCPKAKNLTYEVKSWGNVFDWTDAQENYVTISFYGGLALGHIPSGILSDLFGGKHFFAMAILFSGVICFISPQIMERTSWEGTAVLCLLHGVIQSFPNTAMYALMANWIPRYQIVFYSCIVHAGKFVGIMLSHVITTILRDRYKDWKQSFYIWGMINLIAYCILYCLIHSRPSTHPFVTPKERQLIEKDFGALQPKHIPYGEILPHSAIWSLLCGEFGHSWLWTILVENLRKYLSAVVGLPPSTITFTFFISHSCTVISIILVGRVADAIFAKVKMPTIYFRGIFTAIGNLLCSLVLYLIPYVGCNEYVITTMFSLASAIKGVFYSGVKVNVFDITRNFAGTMYGVENGIGSAFSKLMTPSVISFTCKDNTITQWTNLLWLSVGVSMLTTTLCFIWGKGTRAEWDKIPVKVEEEEDE